MRDLRHNTAGQIRFATTDSEFFLLATPVPSAVAPADGTGVAN